MQLLVTKSQMANAICLHGNQGKYSTRTNEMVLVHLRKRPVKNGTTGRTQPRPGGQAYAASFPEGLPFSWRSQKLNVYYLTQSLELSYKVDAMKSQSCRKRLEHRKEMPPDQAGTQSTKTMKLTLNTRRLHVFQCLWPSHG